MIALQVLLIAFTLLLVFATVAPLSQGSHWLIRGWDFPRLQLAGALAFMMIASLVAAPFSTAWNYLLASLSAICLGYQIYQILPYTIFWKKQVKKNREPISERSITLLASNVYGPNKHVELLKELIREKKPHLLLTLESNQWWENQLQSIEAKYPYTVKVPLENLYGMHLYSKLELVDMEVKFLIEPDIPSIHGFVKLESGELVEIHCLHPMPPSPTESPTSQQRDAELLMVGKDIDTDKGPVIVCGDLNDVAWSRTTRLFQKTSGLLDPRKGRGFFNTFNANYPILRWPLDHFFHSNHFTLVHIERMGNIGSDHFPMYISLHLEPEERHEQEEPETTAQEDKVVAEKIEEGR